jgi:hypothetical protein
MQAVAAGGSPGQDRSTRRSPARLRDRDRSRARSRGPTVPAAASVDVGALTSSLPRWTIAGLEDELL